MYFISFDVGGTSVKYALLNDTGHIFEKSSYKTPVSTKEAFYKEIIDIVNNYCLKYEISGICISSPGIIDSKKGTVNLIYAIPALQGVNVKRELEEILQIDVAIENDAKCAALAEVWQGNAKNYQDSVFVVVGTGIGGAVVKNKKIHHGANLFSGEFGMMIMNTPEGKIENWSYLGSAINLVKRCVAITGDTTLDGEKVFEMAYSGNEDIKKEVNKFYNYLAMGIYNLQFLYDPQAIIIGGGISKRTDLVENVNKALDEIYKVTGAGPNISVVKTCEFTADANLIGALYNFLYA